MADIVKDITSSELQQISARITQGVGGIIEQSKRTIAVYLNSTISMTYWNIGRYIAKELEAIGDEKYGSKIVATVSRQLTEQHVKGSENVSYSLANKPSPQLSLRTIA